MIPGTLETALDHVLAATDRADSAPVAVTDAGLSAQLATEGRQVATDPLSDLPDASVAGVLLVDDELSRAGEQAEGLIADVARVLQPGGILAATARNRLFSRAAGLPLGGLRGYTGTELERLLGHRGFTIELLCAPGAAGRLRASLDPDVIADDAPLDVATDREPGLLDAAPRLLAVAHSPRDAAARSDRFFQTLPRKVVAAAVICRANDGRMLVVHDAFKGHWTIPGGVVDAGESPRDGAEREAYEETGVRVATGPVLGLFLGTWPDRLVVVYEGVPLGGGTPEPDPVAAHEVDAARWLSPREAIEVLAPGPAFQVRRCLAEPGGTWAQPKA